VREKKSERERERESQSEREKTGRTWERERESQRERQERWDLGGGHGVDGGHQALLDHELVVDAPGQVCVSE